MTTQSRRTSARAFSTSLVLALAACATTTHEPVGAPSIETSVAEIADRLVDLAELRTDMRSIRTYVHSIDEERPRDEGPVRAASADANEERTSRLLEKEFTLALANSIYVVGSASSSETPETATDADLRELAKIHGATLVLIGEYVRRGADLELTVQLVDAETRVIVAATRGAVPAEAVGWVAPEPEPMLTEKPSPTEVARSVEPDRPAVVPLRLTRGGTVGLGAGTADSAAEPSASSFAPAEARPSFSTEKPEDFETWRARQVAEGKLSPRLPKAQAAESAPTDRPWLTPRLAELLEVPERTSPPAPPTRAVLPENFPWRTPELSKLLGIPSKD